MKVIKNIIDDAIEYNKRITRLNFKNKEIKLEPVEEEVVILESKI